MIGVQVRHLTKTAQISYGLQLPSRVLYLTFSKFLIRPFIILEASKILLGERNCASLSYTVYIILISCTYSCPCQLHVHRPFVLRKLELSTSFPERSGQYVPLVVASLAQFESHPTHCRLQRPCHPSSPVLVEVWLISGSTNRIVVASIPACTVHQLPLEVMETRYCRPFPLIQPSNC